MPTRATSGVEPASSCTAVPDGGLRGERRSGAGAVIAGASVSAELILGMLAAPGVFTAAILIFIFAWNEFLFARTFMNHAESYTVPPAICCSKARARS